MGREVPGWANESEREERCSNWGDREGEFEEMSSILDLWIFMEISRRDLAAWTEAHSTRPKEVIKI